MSVKKDNVNKAIPDQKLKKEEAELKSVRGMNDFFNTKAMVFENIQDIAKKMAKENHFATLHLPILEFSKLYERNLGEDSDVVSKEIYKFKDRGDNILALRPEFTAGVARYFISNGLSHNAMPQKIFSYGPLFRYDRPQRGRYRQFNQINYEIFGVDSAFYDIYTINIATRLLKLLEIKKYRIEINFLPDKKQGEEYHNEIKKYFMNHYDELSEDSKKRVHKNALRIFDSKDENDKKLFDKAPKMELFLSEEEKSRKNEVLNGLKELLIDCNYNQFLVRGLDYYDGMVFEIISEEGHLRPTILAGGRYNNLLNQLSQGKVNVPAIGFAGGVERLMLLNNKVIDSDRIAVTMENEENAQPENREERNCIAILKAIQILHQNEGLDYAYIIVMPAINEDKTIKKAIKQKCKGILFVDDKAIESKKARYKNLSTREEKTVLLTETDWL